MFRIILLLSYCGHLSYVHADTLKADILENVAAKKLLFKFTRTEESHHVIRKYTDVKSQQMAREDLDYDGDKLKKLSLEQDQLDEKGSITISEDKIHFEYTKDGKIKTANEKWDPDFIVIDQIYPFLIKNWDRIMEGDTVSIRLGVMDRLETVGFKFFKEKDDSVDGKEMTVIKMKPSSFIIAAIVNPILFYFEKGETRKLNQVVGRTLPKVKTANGKWTDLDAILKFQ